MEALQKKAAEAEERFAQAEKESEERLRRAEEAEGKAGESHEALQRSGHNAYWSLLVFSDRTVHSVDSCSLLQFLTNRVMVELAHLGSLDN